MKQDYISNRYQLLRKIGTGGQGEVWLTKSKHTGKEVAIKIIQLNPTNKNNTLQEISLLEAVSTPNCNPYVVCYYDSFYEPSTNIAVIEMEYVQGPNILEYTQPLRNSMNFPLLILTTKLFLKATLLGLKFIHNHNIIHNDIKPSNIIVNYNKVPVIVDFGISCIAQDAINAICTQSYNKVIENCCISTAGTSIYLPPESIRNVRYSSSDLWSLGATAYQIVTGMDIWGLNVAAYDPLGLLKQVIDRFNGNINPYKLNSGDMILDTIVNSFLSYDPSSRMSINQALSLL
jgi:serine/threonine-protein kinase